MRDPNTALELQLVTVTEFDHFVNLTLILLQTMIRENRQIVTNEPVEFEEHPVEFQDVRKITDHFRGIHRIKENQRMSTCNRLDLQTLGSQLMIMFKNLANHWL